MAIIYSYPESLDIMATDLLLGTATIRVAGKKKNITKNFTVETLGLFIQDNYPTATPNLNQVLTVGNTSLLDAKVGKVYLYDTSETEYGNISLSDSGFDMYNALGSLIARIESAGIILSGTTYNSQILTGIITANRTYTLPNKSGTIALVSDIPTKTSDLTNDGADGIHPFITAEDIPVGTQDLNSVLTIGNTSILDANIGNLGIWDPANMGYLQIIGGDNSFTFKDSANNTIMYAEQGIFSLHKTNSIAGNFNTTLLTISRNYSLPNNSGTIALTSDIPTITPTALTKVNDTNVTLTLGGTPNTALLQGVSLTLGWTGTLADSRIASASTWNAKQNAITLTTTGTSGPATLIGSTLNVPDYASGISGTIPQITANGTDTYTATASGVTSYVDGNAYLVRFTNANTTVCTLNINSLGAIPLNRNNDGQLLGGDIWAGGEMLCVYNSTANVFQCIGTSPNSLFAYVTNADSVSITKGQPVYAFGGTGDRMTVKLAFNTSDATSAQTVGVVVTSSIATNQKGIIIIQGLLDGLNILPTSTFADGDPLYLGSTPGTITNVKQFAPNHLVYLGVVTTASNGSAGRWYVRVQNGYELDELHNVQARTPSLNDTLYYDNTVSPAQWKTASIPTILGYTPVTNARTISTTSPLQGGGDLTADRTLSILQSSSTQNGYLSSTDWSTFNSKQNTISLTTTGSGAATFISNVLNIPTPVIPTVGTWGALNYPTWTTGTPFVKMTAAGTFALDTNTYLTSVGTGVTNELTYWSGANTLGSLTTATYPSLTELSYVKGVTSSIQTQLGTKQATITGGATTIVSSDLTASRVLVSDASGKVAANTVTTTTLSYLDATSSIQTQLNAKQGTLTLTTTGTSGAATLVGSTLNIPQYAGGSSSGLLGIHTLVKPVSGSVVASFISSASLSTISTANGRITVLPYIPAQTITSASLYINVTVLGAGINGRILIYSDLNGRPDTKIYESANLDCSTTGQKTATTTQTFTAGTTYWIGTYFSGTATVTSYSSTTILPIAAVAPTSLYTNITQTTTFGSAPSSFGTGTLNVGAPMFVGIITA